MDRRQRRALRLRTILGVVVAGLAVTLAAGACSPGRSPQGSAASPAADLVQPLISGYDDEGVEPTGSPSPTPTPSATTGRPSAKPSKASPKPSNPYVYATYGVTYTIAQGGTGVVGSGTTLKRYEVAVQKGLPQSPADVAARVEQILGNADQGWLRGGQWRFQRVSSGPVDFIVELTTAKDTTAICARFGLDTAGVVSCRGGRNVVINELRWRTGTNGTTQGSTAYSPADYQALVINHEVGHALGHAHVPCPGAGQPAPVMQPQYFGLDGCVPNIWPYSDAGAYLD